MITRTVGVRAFSLLELIIVVAVIGIIAAVAIPRVSSAVERARLNALKTNLNLLRDAVDRYRAEHLGRGPHQDENGNVSFSNADFDQRITRPTTVTGEVDNFGEFGPYLEDIPGNPFISTSSVAKHVRIGGAAAGTGGKGWHLDPVEVWVAADDSVQHAAY